MEEQELWVKFNAPRVWAFPGEVDNIIRRRDM